MGKTTSAVNNGDRIKILRCHYKVIKRISDYIETPEDNIRERVEHG